MAWYRTGMGQSSGTRRWGSDTRSRYRILRASGSSANRQAPHISTTHTHTHHALGQATRWQRTDGVAHVSNVDPRGVNLGSSAARGQKREPTLGALHDERLLRVCVINAVQNERRVAWQTTPSKCAHMSCGAINPAGVDRRIDTHRSTARRPLRL